MGVQLPDLREILLYGGMTMEGLLNGLYAIFGTATGAVVGCIAGCGVFFLLTLIGKLLHR
jgi:hypothetical protein